MRKLTMIRPAAIFSLVALSAGSAAVAQTAAGPKVAVIEIQAAIFQTKDGQKALADLQAKFNPVKAKLETQRTEIAGKEDSLRKGANTMSDEARGKLQREIEDQTKRLNRATDDANADLEQDNQKLMNELGGKMMAIINKYATEKGFVLVLDVSAQNTPVLWASNTIDITRDIIAAYDAGAATITPAKPPATTTSAPGVRPTVPAASKPAPASSGIQK